MILVCNSFLINYDLISNSSVTQEISTNSDSIPNQESYSEVSSKINKISSFVHSYPIKIDNDSHFQTVASSEGWTGNGSLLDPYIIENYNFTPLINITQPLFQISDTTVYFEIRDSIFTNGSDGIRLDNVANGLIINSSFSIAEQRGLFLLDSSFITITNCDFYNNTQNGLHVFQSTNITIDNIEMEFNNNYASYIDSSINITYSNVYASNNGINCFFGYGSTDNIILNNVTSTEVTSNRYGGIHIARIEGTALVKNCNVFNNRGDGIYLAGEDYEPSSFTIKDSQVINNSRNGINIIGSYGSPLVNVELENLIIEDNDFNGIDCVSETSINRTTINNCTITNNDIYGVVMIADYFNLTKSLIKNNFLSGLYYMGSEFSNSIILENSIFENNGERGVLCFGSNITIIQGNTIKNNTLSGIQLEYGRSYEFFNNTFENNINYGLYCIQSANGVVLNNTFINNYNSSFSQACDNNNLTSQYSYNFWSDYEGEDLDFNGLGDVPYYLDGIISTNPENQVKDNFPLYPSIKLIDFPTNGTEIEGNDILVEISSNIPGTLYTYVLNETVLLDSTTETSIDLTDLDPGYYVLTIIANNSGIIVTYIRTFSVGEEVIQVGISLILNNPNGGEILSGIVPIEWTINLTGSWSYLIEYSNDNGSTWYIISELTDTTDTSFDWDTTNYLDNENSLLRITLTTDDIGSMDLCDGLFSLSNGIIQLEEGINEISFTDNINITISVSEAINVTIEQLSDDEVPDLSDYDSYDLIISIELDNPLALNYLWINTSISEFGEQDISKLKFYFFDEDAEEWELIETSGVYFDNEVVWCYVDHITLFGALKRKSEGDSNIFGTILIVTAFLAILGALGSVIFYYAMQQKE